MLLFDGVHLFISKELVPAEKFDALRIVVERNGAQIHRSFDPSRNGVNDYHIIIERNHEMIEELKRKECQMIGSKCVFDCTEKKRSLPKQGFTCCLTMDGIKILASGFDEDEKVKIKELVTEMGGALHAEPSLDLDFVIVKNVLASDYQWALNILKKPIVSYGWLKQCSDEHRIVPQESYKLLPFSGLKICVTQIPAEKRKEMETVIIQNGGEYFRCLTRKCTHLICGAIESDEYFLAISWGHIHVVTEKWFEKSIAKRVCMNEKSFPVQSGSLSSCEVDSAVQHSQEKDIGKIQFGSSSRAADSNMLDSYCAKSLNLDPDAKQSKHMSSVSKVTLLVKEADAESPSLQTSNELNYDSATANLVKGGVQSFQTDQTVVIKDFGVIMPEYFEKNKQEKHNMGMNVATFGKVSGRTMPHTQLPDKSLRLQKITESDSSILVKSTNVFKGKTFCLSNLFPEEKRAEIFQLISQGGGEIMSGQTKQSIHYTVECHGVKVSSTGDDESTYISCNWIQSCLEDGCLLKVDSHILFSPLPCPVPLPGFEGLRFCVSQYDQKDNILLLNLCKVLGAKCSNKFNKKVTHLLCKYTKGSRYKASCTLGIKIVTSEWIFECVKQSEVIPTDKFFPKEITTQDQEAGVSTVRNTAEKNVNRGVEPGLYNKVPSKDNVLKDAPEGTHAVPRVAASIGELLDLTSKMPGQRSPGNTGYERSVSSCDQLNEVICKDNPNPRTVLGLSNQWLNSQSPTEVVTYMEDFSGRQRLMDKIRNKMQ